MQFLTRNKEPLISLFFNICRRYGILTVFLLLACLSAWSGSVWAATATISEDWVSVYSGPGNNYDLAGILPRNTSCEILESDNGWYHIQAENINGWLADNMFNRISATKAQASVDIPSRIEILSGSVNLRQGAGTSFDIVGTLVPGTVLQVLSKQDNWYMVCMSNGSTAYVASWLVTDASVPAVSISTNQQTNALNVQNLASITDPPITVYVNGKLLTFDISPVINNGHTLVPVRTIFEALGARVTWDESSQTVTAQKGDTTVALKIGSITAAINEQNNKLDVPAVIVGNRTLVPLRFVGEALGGRVAWNESDRQIKIFSPPQAGDKLIGVMVEGNCVNLRSNPSTTADLLTTVSKDMQLDVNDEQNGWYQVTYQGQSGWLAGWFVKPVWESEMSTSSTPSDSANTILGDNQLALNCNKSADGFYITMQGSAKLQVKISETAGAIIYDFNDCQLDREYNIQEIIGNMSLNITGSNQGSEAVVKVVLPDKLAYRKSTDDDGLKQTLFIPNCILAVDRTTFSSSGERLDINTLLSATPTQVQNDNTMVITLPGVAQGLAQSAYSYTSQTFDSLTIEQKASESGYNTLITIQTTDAAKFSVERGDKDGQIRIMLILKKDIPAGNSLVVLDPGHGGKDAGTCGSFSKEKDINLAVALKVGDLLTQKGINVAYTRTTDVFVPLTSESATANIMNAALFVAIHCNGVDNIPNAQGTETLYYAPESNPDLYMQKDDRKKLAEAIQERLVVNLGRRDRGVKSANESVLRNTEMPSALAELAFLSNSQEETLLNQDDFQNKAAQAIADAIAACLPVSAVVQN